MSCKLSSTMKMDFRVKSFLFILPLVVLTLVEGDVCDRGADNVYCSAGCCSKNSTPCCSDPAADLDFGADDTSDASFVKTIVAGSFGVLGGVITVIVASCKIYNIRQSRRQKKDEEATTNAAEDEKGGHDNNIATASTSNDDVGVNNNPANNDIMVNNTPANNDSMVIITPANNGIMVNNTPGNNGIMVNNTPGNNGIMVNNTPGNNGKANNAPESIGMTTIPSAKVPFQEGRRRSNLY